MAQLSDHSCARPDDKSDATALSDWLENVDPLRWTAEMQATPWPIAMPRQAVEQRLPLRPPPPPPQPLQCAA